MEASCIVHRRIREGRDGSVTAPRRLRDLRTDQFSNDYHTAHISSVYYLHSYQSLAMPSKGRDTPADRPRDELEEEEETVQTLQYSQDQVHHSGTAARPNGEVNDDCEFGSVEEDGDEDVPILKQFLQDQLLY